MKNKYGSVGLFDDDDFDLMDDDDTPYQSVSSRPPLEDEKEAQMQMPAPTGGPNPQIMAAIARKQKPQFDMSAHYGQEPLMQQFEKQNEDTRGLQATIAELNFANNLGDSFSSAAYGADAAPDSGLSKNISSQNAELLKVKERENSNRAKIMQAIEARKGQQAREGKMDNYREQMLGFRKGQAELSNDLRKGNLDNRIETSANAQAAKETNSYVKSLDASKRLSDVLDQIKAGKLKSSSNVEAAINADMAQLLTNSSSTAVSDRQHGEIKALEKSWNKIKEFSKSSPQNTIPKEYLDQFLVELNILRHSVLENYQNKVSELKSGTKNPQKQEIFQNRFESQRNGNYPGTLGAEVQIIDPHGKIRMVPVEQVDAAIAAGGKRI